jgi:hypothetical protein
MFTRRANKPFIRWDLTLLLLILLLVMAAPGVAISASKTINGSWGCYGQGAFGTLVPSPPTTFAPQTFGETLQLSADSNGHVTSGTILYGGGEVCHFSVASGSTYAIDSTGLGDLNLNLTLNPDDDSDVDCSTSFGSTTPTVDIKVLLTSGNKQFFFTTADDYITSKTSDTGDFTAISGQCLRQ